MLRALTIEFLLISLFTHMVMSCINPDLLDWKFGGAVVIVFLVLWVRDVAITLHELAILNSLGEEDEE